MPKNKRLSDYTSEDSQSTNVEINSATLNELINIPGIGPEIAKRIISARPITDLNELYNIQGIGPTVFTQIEPFITLSTIEEISNESGKELADQDIFSESYAEATENIEELDYGAYPREYQKTENEGELIDAQETETINSNGYLDQEGNLTSSDFIGDTNGIENDEVYIELPLGIKEVPKEVEGFEEEVIASYKKRMMLSNTKEND